MYRKQSHVKFVEEESIWILWASLLSRLENIVRGAVGEDVTPGM